MSIWQQHEIGQAVKTAILKARPGAEITLQTRLIDLGLVKWGNGQTAKRGLMEEVVEPVAQQMGLAISIHSLVDVYTVGDLIDLLKKSQHAIPVNQG